MDPVQQIKERLSIVEVVGQYVKLTKAGKNYKGLSPFRNEKTPSFYVSPDKGMYYDFSSSQGGDVFTFVQQMEGLDFKGALVMLAERAGVTLKHENKKSRDARERLYGVLEDACAFYETKLQEDDTAMQYLYDRGLEDATIRGFRIGFAPEGWQLLRDYLESKGYRQHELETAGLTKKGEKGSAYDRFRSRIMFPIMDSAGRVVAFSGRVIGEAAKDEKNAKYINSPETPLFDKSKILYGYHKAKQFIRKYDFSILVEGQMDIVLSHQAGYVNTVAVSGTGLTVDHLTLLDRLSKKLVMAFDADAAGIASSGRAASLALVRGMDVKVAHVPFGKDPADCIKEDKELWRTSVKEAAHVIDFFTDIVLREHKESGGDERSLILQIRDRVLPYIAHIPSGVDQAQFVRSLANKFSLSEESIWQDVKKSQTHLDASAASPSPTVHTHTTVPETSSITRKHEAEEMLAGFLFWQETMEPQVLQENYLQNKADELNVTLEPILARHTELRESLAFQAELAHDQKENPHILLDSLLTTIAREHLLEERTRLAEALRAAEREHNESEAQEVLTQFTQVSTRIEQLS